MEFKSRYITADDFKAYTGIDLHIELKDDDNASNKVDAFLYRNEIRLERYVAYTFFVNVKNSFEHFTDYQKEQWKFALLEQALYILFNGEISVVGSENGEKKPVIAPNTKEHLILCGFNTDIDRRTK